MTAVRFVFYKVLLSVARSNAAPINPLNNGCALFGLLLNSETNDAHLKSLIKKYLPYFDAVEEFCAKMKMPPTVTDREVIISGIKRALIMRDRYTILFYLRDMGKFEEYAERAADKLLEII